MAIVILWKAFLFIEKFLILTLKDKKVFIFNIKFLFYQSMLVVVSLWF